MKSKPKILVVEDEQITALEIKTSLNKLGYDAPVSVMSGEEAVAKAEEIRPDLVLMDIHLKGKMDGVEAAKKIQKTLNLPIIYLTANTDDRTLQRAKIAEPYGYVLKPFEMRELHSNIEMALYRHKMEIALRESEQKYRSIFESFLDLYYQTNMEGIILNVSPSCKAISGWKPEEVIGRRVLDLFPERERGEQLIEELLREGSIHDFEIKLHCKDGRKLDVSVNSRIICEKPRKLHHIEGTVRDISDRKRAENELQKKIYDLERFNKIVVDREIKMIELKQEVNALLDELGRDERYKAVMADELE